MKAPFIKSICVAIAAIGLSHAAYAFVYSDNSKGTLSETRVTGTGSVSLNGYGNRYGGSAFSGLGTRDVYTITVPNGKKAKVSITKTGEYCIGGAANLFANVGNTHGDQTASPTTSFTLDTTKTINVWASGLGSLRGGPYASQQYNDSFTCSYQYEISVTYETEKVTVSFEVEGATYTTRSVAVGSAIGTLPTPTRNGYVFTGWYTAVATGTKITAATVVTGSVRYYAHWTTDASKKVTIVFDANGGSGGATKTITKGDAFSSLPTPTRSGYKFAGWYTERSGGEEIFAYWTPMNSNATFYAHWVSTSISTYTLTANPNGGALSGGNFGAKNGTTSSANVTVKYGSTSYNSLGKATRSGYNFSGWYTSSSGGTRVFDANGKCVTGTYWNSSKQWQYRGNLTVYAQWTAIETHKLTANPNGGFLSGVNFGSNNGTSAPASVTVKIGSTAYNSLGKATRSGYTFNGWYTSSSGGTKVFDANGKCVTGLYWNLSKQWQYHFDLKVYAQWTAIPTYTLTANPNGGVLSGGNFGAKNGTTSSASVTVRIGSTAYYSLGKATRSGYTFNGWYTSSSGGTKVFDVNGKCVTGTYWNSSKQWQYHGNLTVYAQWTAIPTYTLTANPNGGVLVGGNFGAKNGTTSSASVTVRVGSTAYYSLGKATRSGYTFSGWYTSPSGGTRVFDANGKCVHGEYWNMSKQWLYSGNLTVYALWTPMNYYAPPQPDMDSVIAPVKSDSVHCVDGIAYLPDGETIPVEVRVYADGFAVVELDDAVFCGYIADGIGELMDCCGAILRVVTEQ